jgi:outer membrane protein
MKRKFIVWTMMMFCAAFTHAQDTKLTLQKSIETALANNIPTKQSELLMRNAEINYKQAKFNRLPSIDGSFSYGINSGRSIDPFTNGYINQNLTSSNANSQAVLPLFSGFQLKNLIRQNEFAFATATMEWQQRKDELTLQVILAYLQILNNEDALKLARQRADLSKQQVDRLEIMAREGAGPPGNLSDLKGQFAGDQLTIINAENSLETSRITLAQLMNVAYDTSLNIDRTGFDSTIKMYDALPNDIYNTALEKLASVKASELRVKTSATAVKVASSYYSPTVSLYGVLNTNYSSAAAINQSIGSVEVPSGDYVTVNGTAIPVITKQNKFSSQKIAYGSQFNNNLSTAYGVSVSIPIFSRFRARSNVKLARNEERNSRLIADNIKVLLRQSVDQAYVNITTTYKRYQALQDQVAAYAESFRIASIRFENGAIASPEYLIAKNNLEQAQAMQINARYEYLLRSKVLDFYMGRLN